jgi:hypothetical protein
VRSFGHCAILYHMARALLKYTMVALLAFFSTQAVVPSPCLAASVEIVGSRKAGHQIAREEAGIMPPAPIRAPASLYVSRTRLQSEAVALFQRPPPFSFPHFF